jgi:hypothetical protein
MRIFNGQWENQMLFVRVEIFSFLSPFLVSPPPSLLRAKIKTYPRKANFRRRDAPQTTIGSAQRVLVLFMMVVMARRCLLLLVLVLLVRSIVRRGWTPMVTTRSLPSRVRHGRRFLLLLLLLLLLRLLLLLTHQVKKQALLVLLLRLLWMVGVVHSSH